MNMTDDQAVALLRKGAELLNQSQAPAARQAFEQVIATGRTNAQILLLLAAACAAMNDVTGEEAAIDKLLAIDPKLLRALIRKGDCRASLGDDRTALRFYEIALLQADAQNVAADFRGEINRVQGIVDDWKTRAENKRETALVADGFPVQSRTPRFQESLDILAGRKQIFVQQPTGYYYPGLPNIQYFDTADFEWAPSVEAATEAIRDELSALLADSRAGFRPYMHADVNSARTDNNALANSADWSALFLCENGDRNEDMISRCPKTWEAMQTVPLFDAAFSPTIMFSLLRPGARIAAHTGMFNTRLICHLPLIVPSDCYFRVGNDVRQWQPGKLFIFDDTIEHEAWNDSKEDRVVLIFDIWRPEFSEQQRREINAFFQSTAA